MTAKYLAAINIKEKSHEASEYKYNYLHFTPRLSNSDLVVKCSRAPSESVREMEKDGALQRLLALQPHCPLGAAKTERVSRLPVKEPHE